MDILGAGVALGSGLLSYLGQKETNSANAALANQQMAFQQNMSSSSYQRAVEDMKAAGLNPMLAYSQGGASSPGGSTAVMGNALEKGVNSAHAGSQLVAQNDLLKAQAQEAIARKDLTQVETMLRATEIPKVAQETSTGAATAAQLKALAEQIGELTTRYRRENQGDIGWENAMSRTWENLFHQARWNYEPGKGESSGTWIPHAVRAAVDEAVARARREGFEATVSGYRRSEARQTAAAYDRFGGAVLPYLGPLSKTISSGAAGAAALRYLSR